MILDGLVDWFLCGVGCWLDMYVVCTYVCVRRVLIFVLHSPLLQLLPAAAPFRSIYREMAMIAMQSMLNADAGSP